VRAKGHPEHHGTIERLIGTMMRRIHERRGTTFGSMPYERRQLVRTGFRLFRVDYSARDLLAMWKRQNQEVIERLVVYDPRSLATVWVVDDATGGYIAVPYRVPRADMTLAESEAARRQLRALKAADRTEARLFERVLQVRAIEQEGRTTTSRMKAERSRQRGALSRLQGCATMARPRPRPLRCPHDRRTRHCRPP
jgi:hypothetical protein